MKRTTLSERALVIAPRGRDATIAAAMLAEAGVQADVCRALPDLIAKLDEGAALVVLTEEAIATTDLHPLSVWLTEQEEWSDLPFVLLTSRGGGLERNPAAVRHLDVLGNVTFLERPFHPTSLVSLVRSGLRARRRQYEARARLIELRESEEQYRLLFDTMDEGFCVLQFIDGPLGPDTDYIHSKANAAYSVNAGIPNIVGKRLREVVSGGEADDWVSTFREVLTSGTSIRFERELKETNRYLELAAFRVEPPERREVAVLFKDVTARRRAEVELLKLNETLEQRVADTVAEREEATAQLHEAQKLETLGQLTGGVAHDFNNLLTPITGTLDLLARKDHDPRTARLVDGALQSAERARVLVSRLLGFARRQALEVRSVDVSALLDGMRDLLSSSLGPQIELTMAAVDELPAAMADPNQLELAILNLCVNGRDAMPNGGTLTVTAERETVGPSGSLRIRPGAYVRISVVDTGTGMSAETLARAVEPFYSTKEMGKGTGLGLSMVHGLAAQLGGVFTLHSTVGEGTRADLYLPVASVRADPATRTAPALPLHIDPLSILLVDDEELVRWGTAEMLRAIGHQVQDVETGAEALTILQSQRPFDLMVTDYMMPRMNGAELAGRVGQIRPGLPTLIVTGYAGGELDIGLPQLAKPFRQTDLALAIERLMGRCDRNVVQLTSGRR